MSLYLAASEGDTYIDLSITFGVAAAKYLCDLYGEDNNQEGLQNAVSKVILIASEAEDLFARFKDDTQSRTGRVKMKASFTRCSLASLSGDATKPDEQVRQTILNSVCLAKNHTWDNPDYFVSVHIL